MHYKKKTPIEIETLSKKELDDLAVTLYNTVFSESIRCLRKKLRYSQIEFAGKIGIDNRTLQDYEQDIIIPRKSTVISICIKLNLPFALSEALLSSLKYDLLRPSVENDFYLAILKEKNKKSICEYNDIITKMNKKLPKRSRIHLLKDSE